MEFLANHLDAIITLIVGLVTLCNSSYFERLERL